jgi:hypothetical protein
MDVFLPYRLVSAEIRPEESSFERIVSFEWVEASSLAADQWRPTAH